MLIDPQFKQPDPHTKAVLELISGMNTGELPTPKRIDTGMYLIGHYSPDMYVNIDQWEHFWGYKLFSNAIAYDYGVCDSPVQLTNKYAYKKLFSASKTHYCVFFTPIAKKDQPSEGGWRWEKWGHYEGKQKPQADYLYDEPKINLVYCFDILRYKG